MAWARFGDEFEDEPEILTLGHAAFRLYTSCVFYSCKHETHGFLRLVQIEAKARLHNIPARSALRELVTNGALQAVEGGYQIPDFERRHGKPVAKDPTGAKRQQEYRGRQRQGNVPAPNPAPSDPLPTLFEDEAEGESTVTSPLRNGVTNRDSNGSHARVSRPDPTRPVPTSPPIPPPPTVSGGGAEGDLGGGGGLGEFADLAQAFGNLSPEELLRRFRSEFPHCESRLATAIATATRPVRSQALYLRPLILRILNGQEPDPIPLPPVPSGGVPGPSTGRESASDINARITGRMADLGLLDPTGDPQ